MKLASLTFIVSFTLFLCSFISVAQTDSLVFTNGQSMVGNIKSMERGKIMVETDYSDSDFIIDWAGVAKIYSTSTYLVSIADGRRFDCSIRSVGEDGMIDLYSGSNSFAIHKDKIVYINPISQSFWDKISANVDLGYNITKANNLVQFNTRTYLGYLTRRWELNGNYNTVFSSQDSVANTRRMDANITFKFFLPNDFYVFISNDFLSNDEQKLKLRSTAKLGAGNYIVHSNAVYWSVYGGAAFNNETFTESTDPPKQTGEVFLGTEFNMFNTGDFGLLTNIVGYPNLTDKGRMRVDFRFDLTYDLPLDFYIKAGTTVNYDNQPVEGASSLDYVIQTGFGWEW